MAHIQCEPYLSKKEEYKLLRVVRKCLAENPRNQYKNIQEIQDYFMKPKKREYKIPKNYTAEKKGIVAGIIILLIIFCALGIRGEKETKIVETLPNEMSKEKDMGEYLDIGIRYFLELKDYEKSIECFQKAASEDIKAEYYEKLAEFMLTNSLDIDVKDTLELLKAQVEEEKDIRELLVLIRVYAMLDTTEDYQTIIELSKEVILRNKWELLDENLKNEFYEYHALACEKLKLWEDAVDSYNTLLELNDGEKEREQIFLRLIEVYTRKNDIDKVIEKCKTGVGELPQSVELCVKYVESLWLDQKMDNNVRVEEIRKILIERPEIANEEAFIRLVRTKGVRIEGENVWIEK